MLTMTIGELEAAIGPVAASWARDRAISADHTAEDLLQIGLTAVLEKASKFNPERATPHVFAAMVARSTFGKVRRALLRRPGHAAQVRLGARDEQDGEGFTLPSRDKGPVREAELAECREAAAKLAEFLRKRGRGPEADAIQRVLDGVETKPDYRIVREVGVRYPVRKERIGRTA